MDTPVKYSHLLLLIPLVLMGWFCYVVGTNVYNSIYIDGYNSGSWQQFQAIQKNCSASTAPSNLPS